jgi:PTS system fructose-specific IIC component
MSAAFRCQSPAPHGGLWVVAVIGHPGFYVLTLAAGSFVAMLILSLLKKKLPEEEFASEQLG